MSDFRAPLDDIRFTLRRIADLDGLARLPRFEHADPDLIDGLLDEAARFAEQVIAPLDEAGDTVGARRNDDGTVTTAPGFAAAYARYVEAGWGAVALDPDYGGGGLPHLLAVALEDMFGAACMSFGLCPLLTQGAINMLSTYGDDAQKARFLPRMVTGEWSGTMNLTEPQAGSDLGLMTTRAVPHDDGTYRITGTKIFITYGEHDMVDNIVHLVLARTPDSPAGTRGISCFIVPKFVLDERGEPAERNDITCVSLEHKLGIHASPTCVLSFGDHEGAVGYLVGEEHAGMRYMFAMMNQARLSVGVEGVSVAERAYQQALGYAHERRQGRAPGASSDSPSPIVEHPDVRRMLLDMRSTIAAMRGLAYRNAEAVDRSLHAVGDAERAAAAERAALLTPLTKAWASDVGCELTSTALQVHGGMGYIEETGAARHFRDARITPIYEGTNGIQSVDLVGRKLTMRGGAAVREHLDAIAATVGRLAGIDGLAPLAEHLGRALSATTEATDWLLGEGADMASRLAGATAYLEMLATTTAGAVLADGALAAREHESVDEAEDRAVMARFFASQRLSAVPGRLAAVTESAPDIELAARRLLRA
ncbi:MAG: acyl-CoA dehydrogenase [Acidimicrobiales bacterium]